MILNPGDIAVDYIAKKDPAKLVAAGVRLVVRYDSPNPANPKNLIVAERVGLHNAGLSLLVVFEDSATSPLQGAPLGAKHGALARLHALTNEYPAEYEIIVAVDFDVQPAQMPTVLAYLGAFKTESGWEQGTYGKDTVVTAAAEAGLSTLGWQTVAWSYRRISPYAHVLQHATPVHSAVAALGSIDDNTVLRTFRAWSTTVDPPSIPTPGDIDMPRFFDNAETRTMPYGQALPQTAVFISDIEKRNIGAEEYTAWGSPARVSLSNAALDAIPDAGVILPPIVVPPITGHIVADLGAGGHITGSIG